MCAQSLVFLPHGFLFQVPTHLICCMLILLFHMCALFTVSFFCLWACSLDSLWMPLLFVAILRTDVGSCVTTKTCFTIFGAVKQRFGYEFATWSHRTLQSTKMHTEHFIKQLHMYMYISTHTLPLKPCSYKRTCAQNMNLKKVCHSFMSK